MHKEVRLNNNEPDPLLSGKELPTFKFELEKSTGKVIGGSVGKEATVAQLPISKGIAGVSMTLEPGVMRELHWHATAAEWAFVVSRPRPHDGHRSRAATPKPTTSSPATSGTFPAATATCSAASATSRCHFILIFDNGYFSEFGTFSITDWIGHAPKPLLAKNFGLPESAFDGFPKSEVYFAKGAIPSAEQQPNLQGLKSPPDTHKFRMLAEPPHSVHKGGREWRVDCQPLPHLDDDHRRGARTRTGRPPRAALASHLRRMAVRPRRPGERHDVRLRRPLPHRNAQSRATSATSRKASATRSKTSASRRAGS